MGVGWISIDDHPIIPIVMDQQSITVVVSEVETGNGNRGSVRACIVRGGKSRAECLNGERGQGQEAGLTWFIVDDEIAKTVVIRFDKN